MKLIAVAIATVNLATALAEVVDVNDQQSSAMNSLMRTKVSSSIGTLMKRSTINANRNLQDSTDFQLFCVQAFESNRDFQCSCDTNTTNTANCTAPNACDEGTCTNLTFRAEFDSSFVLDWMKLCIESVPTDPDVPAICITLNVSGEVVDSCFAELKHTSSTYEQCKSCKPCINSTGLQGLDIDCSNHSYGFDTKGCLSSTEGSSSYTALASTTALESVAQQLHGIYAGSGANNVKQRLMTSSMVGGMLLMLVV